MKHIFAQPFPIFDLENGFVLDQIKPANDCERYFLYMNTPEVRSFISKGNVPESIDKSREDLQYWSSGFTLGRSIYWAIRDNQNLELVGTVGFNTLSFIHHKGEISYDLSYDYWSKGIMTKAISKIVHFAMNQMQLVRIQAYTAKNNKRSMKLLERCKFKMEGVLRKFERTEGENLDYIMYSIVK
jgi:ribosomal-protein-alanine N-acetyltransferase